MLMQGNRGLKRRGSVLVEYAMLIAGIVLVSVVAIAVLGGKMQGVYAVMAGIMPGAHADDNKPIFKNGELIPYHDDGRGKLVLNSGGLVDPAGLDRMKDMLGSGGGDLLVVE